MKLPRPLKALPGVFRWKYVLPRVIVVAALVLGIHFGLDPSLRWLIVTSGQAALGAKVEVGELVTSLTGGEIVVRGLAAANPQKPMRNLLEAGDMQLVLDAGQLLRKRFVVRNGFIRGLRFDSPRTTSGALETAPPVENAGPSMLDPVVAAAGDAAGAWFAGLSGRVEEDLQARLETPRVVKQLEERWPQQYEALKTRADVLRAKVQQFEVDFREAKKNPLRNMQKFAELQQQLAAAQGELKTTMADIAALPAQAKADRAAVDAARRQDEQFLRDALNIAQVDGDQLTQYLLGDDANSYLSQTLWWVETVRHYIPKGKISRPERHRGVDVLFVRGRRPQVLFERVQLEASAQLGGEALTLEGELTDAASEPQFHARPLRLHLKSRGAVSSDLVAVLDRRGDVPHDSLTLDCPRVALPERTLGKPDSLALEVAPGEASLQADVKLDGQQLTGVIHFRQGSTLAASTAAIRDDRLAQVVHQSLAGIDRVEANVQLAGTLQRPRWKVESNLGPQLATALSGAMRQYLTDRKDRLVAKVKSGADEQLAKLDARRQAAQQELLAKLGQDQQFISQLAALAGGQGSLESLAVPQIGEKINLDKLLK
jgi:uncharacterized protein (TIGR03545 family)